MSLKAAVNRVKALAYIYQYFGKNIKKIPRWSVKGGATPAEIEEWNRLQRSLRKRFGYGAAEAREISKEASRRAK